MKTDISINKRNQRIDFLRGIAIIVVLVLHFNLSYHLEQSALANIFSVNFIKIIASNGNYGVTMFFVISGFLITPVTLERYGELRKLDILGFYIFRFARIIPCLLLALTFISIFNIIHIPIFQNDPHSTSWFLAVLSVLTFWHNVLMDKTGYFNYCLNIYWSLSVEEIFYLTFPLICIFLKKLRFILCIWIVFIIVAPIYRSFYTQNEIVALYGYFSCFDAIAIGCCAAIFAKRFQLKGRFWNAIQYTMGLLIVAIYLHAGIMDNIVMGVSFFAIGTAILLIGANAETANQKTSSSLFSRIVCWFGKNSYELYLFHIIVLAFMKEIVSPAALGNYTKLLWMSVFSNIRQKTASYNLSPGVE